MSSTVEVAREIGVSKNTLLRWIQEGYLSDVQRDWRGWRLWSEEDVARARAVKETGRARIMAGNRRQEASRASYAESVAESIARWGRSWRGSGRTAAR